MKRKAWRPRSFRSGKKISGDALPAAHATLPVQTVAVLGYLEPVVSVLCSAIFLHEAMSPLGWTGAALIIAAAVISEVTG